MVEEHPKVKSAKAKKIESNLSLLITLGVRRRKHVDGRFLHYLRQNNSLAMAVIKTCQDFTKSRPEILATVCDNLASVCERSQDIKYITDVRATLPRGIAYGK